MRPWQENQIVRPLFGTLRPDGRRQYRTCYVEIPRKNGKTELAGALGLYMLLGDGEIGAQIYSAANDRDQAALAFNAAAAMVEADPELKAILEVIPSRHRIVHHASGSFYRAIAADATNAHGFNASCVIYDEFWGATNADLWDALRTSSGARPQPVRFIITTAGWDRESPCWKIHEYAEDVLSGQVKDPTFLPVLYGAPMEAPWNNEAVWRAANPALGDFRDLDEMRTEASMAAKVPSQQNSFRRLYLCQWTEQSTRWLDMAAWDKCASEVPDDQLIGHPCYGGLDLGESDDLTAFVRVWDLEDGRVAVRWRFWMPEAAMQKYRGRRYDLWRDGGFLTITEGDITDFRMVEDEVGQLCEESGVRELAYDKRFAEQMAQGLQGLGITCVNTPQGFQLNESLRNIADLVVTTKLCHGGHPVARWMASNAEVLTGLRGDIRLVKPGGALKIDGLAALAMANSRRIVSPGASVYETRGVLTV